MFGWLMVLAAQVPSLSPTSPPGAGPKVQTALHWLSWGIAAACAAAVAIQGARLAWTIRQGGVGVQEHGSSLGWTLLGLSIVGGSGAIVGALI
jgi:hypothetical protein